MFKNRVNRIKDLSVNGDLTKFTWEVGRFESVSFGDAIVMSQLVQGGADEWKLTLFPKGCATMDYASLYVTNQQCENEDSKELKLISIATVKVTITPNIEIKEPKDKAGQGGDDAMSNKSGSSRSVRSRSTAASSSKPGSSRRGGGSQGGSRAGSQAGSQAGSGSKGAAAACADHIKLMSQQFTNLEASWGWEEFLELDLLYNPKKAFLRDIENGVQNGILEIKVEILATTGISFDSPENDPEITPQGRQRTRWLLKDVNTMRKKLQPGQKFSSEMFLSDGEWYLDFYPKGYRTEKIDPGDADHNWLSVYLHSSRQQALLNHTRKQNFRIGILKVNKLPPQIYECLGEDASDEVYFPPNSSMVATFDGAHRCFGLQNLIPVQHLTQGRLLFKKVSPGLERTYKNKKEGVEKSLGMRLCEHGKQLKDCKDCTMPTMSEDDIMKELLSGTYEKGGSITVVLDMSVTDEEIGAVQHALLMYKRYDAPFFSKCNETGKQLVNPSPCYMCGKLFSGDILQVSRVTRFPAWGYETGKEVIMDILFREEEHQIAMLMNNLSFDRKYQEGFKWVTKKLTSLRKNLEDRQNGVVKGAKAAGGDGGGGGATSTNNMLIKSDPMAGLDVGGLDEDEEDIQTHGTESEFMQKKIKAELQKQVNFRNALNKMREALESAHFAKPVCARCLEAAKAYNNPLNPFCYADVDINDEGKLKNSPKMVKDTNPNRPDKDRFAPDPNRFAYNWREILNLTERAYDMANRVTFATAGKLDDYEFKDPVFRKGDEYPAEAKNAAFNSATDDETYRSGLSAGKPTIPITYQGADWTGAPGVGKNAMTLVRGGWYGEFPDTAFQCAGRVNANNYLDDDDEEERRHEAEKDSDFGSRNQYESSSITAASELRMEFPKEAYCDVRFDRIEPGQKKPPEKVVCYATGKIFCKECCKYPYPLIELEKDPSKPKEGVQGLVMCCYSGKEARESGSASLRIQPVSQKNDTQAVKEKPALPPAEEPDDDEDPWYLAAAENLADAVEQIPMCGPTIATKIQAQINA